MNFNSIISQAFSLQDIQGKRILIIGAFFYSNIKNAFLQAGAAECINMDTMSNANAVDCVGAIADVEELFGEERFDVVLLLEGLETTLDYQTAIQKLKRICCTSGILFVATRTPNSQVNYVDERYNADHWRFDREDVRSLFADGELLILGNNQNQTLSLVKWVKSEGTQTPDYKAIPVYCCRLQRKVLYSKELQNLGFFSEHKELDRIGRGHETDKSSLFHNYLNPYEFFLQKFKNQSFTLLELGVFRGSSVKMWRDYFQNAKIVGVDINPQCLQYAENRVEIVTADLANVKNLERLKEFRPSIIIDDASHLWSHQMKALFTLFDCLPSGGVYIMEDLGTSLNTDKWTNFNDTVVSGYDICSQIAEVCTGKTHLRSSELYQAQIEAIGMQTEAVIFIQGSCILIKK